MNCWHKEIDDETGICKACGAKAAIEIPGLREALNRQKRALDLPGVQDSATQEKHAIDSKMSYSEQAKVSQAVEGVCRALAIDMDTFVRTWGCYQDGNLEITLALLDGRNRDEFLRSFGRWLVERKVEFASND